MARCQLHKIPPFEMVPKSELDLDSILSTGLDLVFHDLLQVAVVLLYNVTEELIGSLDLGFPVYRH